jgi:hypothetical protein
MAIHLVAALKAAPNVIASVTGIIQAVNALKSSGSGPNEKTIKEIEDLLEKQAVAMRDIAESNRNLALAVRANRIITGVSLLVAIAALVFAIVR